MVRGSSACAAASVHSRCLQGTDIIHLRPLTCSAKALYRSISTSAHSLNLNSSTQHTPSSHLVRCPPMHLPILRLLICLHALHLHHNISFSWFCCSSSGRVLVLQIHLLQPAQ